MAFVDIKYYENQINRYRRLLPRPSPVQINWPRGAPTLNSKLPGALDLQSNWRYRKDSFTVDRDGVLVWRCFCESNASLTAQGAHMRHAVTGLTGVLCQQLGVSRGRLARDVRDCGHSPYLARWTELCEGRLRHRSSRMLDSYAREHSCWPTTRTSALGAIAVRL